ncbi:hypothetical protein [Methanobrevibacter sp.]|uniref:hypothetical protein n=1 Tax=Methanobrevibacter sp. TaxID=66852 RepID=UPI0025F9CBD9|nr:hypothetical protein [Methanobrevibacter sp.]MBQ2666031.1 hypothetical protein [Methanobrevibacter sp.]
MNIIESVKKIATVLDAPQVEPYTIEKFNKKTGEIEKIHIIPVSAGGVSYNSYPSYLY